MSPFPRYPSPSASRCSSFPSPHGVSTDPGVSGPSGCPSFYQRYGLHVSCSKKKKKKSKLSRKNVFPLHKTKRVMSPHRCLSKEPLWLCPSKDSTSLGVVLCFLQFAPGDGPGAQQGGSFFCTPNVETGETHSSWKRREAASFISRRAALVERLHLKTATENC